VDVDHAAKHLLLGNNCGNCIYFRALFYPINDSCWKCKKNDMILKTLDNICDCWEEDTTEHSEHILWK